MKARAAVYQFGPFEFDPAQFELRRGAERQTLPASLNRLLLLFVSQPGELVTREQIADTLWQSHGTVDVAAGINTAIRRLRTHIGDGNGNGVFIETVVGAGYRFAKPVFLATPEEPARAESTPPEPEAIPLVPASTPTRARLWVGVAVVLVCAAAGGWTLFSHRLVRQPATALPWFPLHTRLVTFDEPEDRLTAQAISPGGRYVAYLDRAGLTVRSLAGGPDRRPPLPRGLRAAQIAWAPDETYLLVGGAPAPDQVPPAKKSESEPPPSETWRVPVTGGPARLLLADSASATVSPDGLHIAFLRARGSEIWVAEADGGSPRKLASTPSGDRITCLLWSPNSERILVDRSEHGLPPLSGVDPPLQRPPNNDAIGPAENQHRAVYESYDARTGALLSRRDGLQFHSAALLRDGTLLFPVDAPSSDSRMAIVQTDPATGAVLDEPRVFGFRQVWSLTSFATMQLTASAAGDELSAILERPAIDVYTADLAAGDSHPELTHVVRLSHHNGSDYPTGWTPDGKEVIFDSGTGGRIDVVGQALEGPSAHTLAATDPQDAKFTLGQISPDGRWLLFLTLFPDSEKVRSIDRIPAQGGKRETLHTTGAVEEFHCSSSSLGRCVLREAEGKNALVYYALDPVAGMGPELARTPWQPNILGDWSLSPDGNTVAVADHDPRRPGIQLVPLATGAPGKRSEAVGKVLPVSGFGTTLGANWSMDGKGLFVETYTASDYNLLWLSFDGHTALLRQSPDLIYAVPSPDGKKISFPGRTRLNRNVWVGTRQATAYP